MTIKARVYRLRPPVWALPLLVVIGVIVFATTPPAPMRWGVIGIDVLPSLALLWFGLRPRTVVDSNGLRLYDLTKTTFVAWRDVEWIVAQGERIQLGTKGQTLNLPAPVSFSRGRRGAEQVAKDLEADRRNWARQQSHG